MTDEPETDPFMQGQRAAEQGKALADNPHADGSDAHVRWREGHASLGPPEDLAEDLGKLA